MPNENPAEDVTQATAVTEAAPETETTDIAAEAVSEVAEGDAGSEA